MASAPSSSTPCVVDDGQPQDRTEKLTANSAVKKRQLQLRGGYECIFVEEPPKHLQTECSICLCILREPCLVDCCGNRFCRTCIEPIQSAEKKQCPLCSEPFTTSVVDKQLQRTLSSLKVFCSHKDVGCDWMGELGNLPQHLNVDSEDDVSVRLNGCKFAQLQCIHCKQSIERQNIAKHEADQCLERPYSCDYCNDYSSTCKDVTDNHWPICPYRSVPCPNKCGKYLLRKDLETHQASECLLAIVKCSFSFAGCKVEIPRNEMPAHITENLADHMSLQAINHQKQLKELQDSINELKAENQKLKNKFDEQNQKLKDQIDEQNKKIATILNNPGVSSKEVTVAATVSAEPEEAVGGDINVAPVLIVFKDFQQHTIWWSPPFYTHPQGYKMCLKVFPNGNRSGENTHVSVYINILKGEFDDRLLWPFRGNLTVRLLRNNSETWYYEKVVSFTERVHPRVSGRVTKGDKLIQGFGIDLFIPQDSLTTLSGYVQDNSLRFRVLTSQVHGFSWPAIKGN